MRRPFTLVIVLLVAVGLAACGESDQTGGGEDADRNLAIAQCGILVRLLNGDVPITVDNVREIQDSLEVLAENGVGAVKPTAQLILEGIEGEGVSDAEQAKAIENLQDFCADYTVD